MAPGITGKEEDVEVGLQYFGKRFLNPLLGRWVSADPLAVHAPGEADLNLYAYVSGSVLKSIDPLGLQEAENGVGGGGDGPDPAPHPHDPVTPGNVYTVDEVVIHGYVEPHSLPSGIPAAVTAAQINDTSSATQIGEQTESGRAAGETFLTFVAAPLAAAGLAYASPAFALTLFIGGAAMQTTADTPVEEGHPDYPNRQQNGRIGEGMMVLGGGAGTRLRMPATPKFDGSLAPGSVFSGHGYYPPANGRFAVPDGSSITFYSTHSNTITDSLGNMIESGADLSGLYSRTYGPGAYVPDYVLTPPTNLKVLGDAVTVQSETNLSTLLKPNMGACSWAACRESITPATLKFTPTGPTAR